MNIDNESKAGQAIEAWKNAPPEVQLRNLRLAIESLELGQMYYEQKNNEKGRNRMIRCIAMLTQRCVDLKTEGMNT